MVLTLDIASLIKNISCKLNALYYHRLIPINELHYIPLFDVCRRVLGISGCNNKLTRMDMRLEEFVFYTAIMYKHEFMLPLICKQYNILVYDMDITISDIYLGGYYMVHVHGYPKPTYLQVNRL